MRHASGHNLTNVSEAGACLMKSRRSSIQRARELRLIMDKYSSIVKRQPSLQVQAACTRDSYVA